MLHGYNHHDIQLQYRIGIWKAFLREVKAMPCYWIRVQNELPVKWKGNCSSKSNIGTEYVQGTLKGQNWVLRGISQGQTLVWWAVVMAAGPRLMRCSHRVRTPTTGYQPRGTSLPPIRGCIYYMEPDLVYFMLDLHHDHSHKLSHNYTAIIIPCCTVATLI